MTKTLNKIPSEVMVIFDWIKQMIQYIFFIYLTNMYFI